MLGKRFYDELNGLYYTPDGVGCDPKVFCCVVEQITESGDFEVIDHVLKTRNELLHYKEVNP